MSKGIVRNVSIFIIGGLGYGLIETLFSGATHWSMLLTGGAVLLTFYYLNRQFKSAPIFLKALGGAAVITLYELAVGVVVNLWLGMNVWDYSRLSGDLWGQICPLFTFLWFILCFFMAAGEYIVSGVYRLFHRNKSAPVS